MQKEILTVNAIRKDLHRSACRSLTESAVTLICSAFLWWLYTVACAEDLLFYDVVLLVFAVAFGILTVVMAADAAVRFTAARTPTVTRDSVAELYTVMRHGRRHLHGERVFGVRYLHCQYCIRFKRYGEYRIPLYVNYRWSKQFSLSDSGVYNYAHVDDDFYVVLAGKRILMAYQADLFTLSQDIEL